MAGATVVVVVATTLIPADRVLPAPAESAGAGAGPTLDPIAQVGYVVMVVGVFAAAGSLIVRWRRAVGVERQQMKWLAYAAAILVVAELCSSLLPRPLFLVVSYTASCCSRWPLGSR